MALLRWWNNSDLFADSSAWCCFPFLFSPHCSCVVRIEWVKLGKEAEERGRKFTRVVDIIWWICLMNFCFLLVMSFYEIQVQVKTNQETLCKGVAATTITICLLNIMHLRKKILYKAKKPQKPAFKICRTHNPTNRQLEWRKCLRHKVDM